MKFLLTTFALSLVLFNAHANCIEKSEITMNHLAKTDRAINISLLVASLFGAGTPLFIGKVAVDTQYIQIRNLNLLLSHAQEGQGYKLDRMADDIKEARPDLAQDKSKLAAILNEANEKETICSHGFITGSLLRTLIMSGELEAANELNHKFSSNDFRIGE